jgi:hypothetical protein
LSPIMARLFDNYICIKYHQLQKILEPKENFVNTKVGRVYGKEPGYHLE